MVDHVDKVIMVVERLVRDKVTLKIDEKGKIVLEKKQIFTRSYENIGSIWLTIQGY